MKGPVCVFIALVFLECLTATRGAIVDAGLPSATSAAATKLLKVKEGNRALLKCFHGGKQSRLAGWSQNGKLVSHDGRRRVMTSGFFLVLDISSVRIMDQGIFECRNKHGDVKKRIKLVLTESWRLEAHKHHLIAFESKTMRLRCSRAKNGPNERLFVKWYYKNSLILPDNRRTIFAKKHSSVLVIENAQLSDAGIFECRGGGLNNLSAARDSIQVEVHAHSKIVESSPNIQEDYVGRNMTLYCNAHGFPVPIVTWFKIAHGASVQIAIGWQYVIRNASYNDTATYKCFAQNKYGKSKKVFKAYVKDPGDKVVVILPTDGSVQVIPFHKRYDLQMSKAAVTCYKDGKEIQLGLRHSFFFSFPFSGFFYLMMTKMQYSDAGRYECDILDKKNGRILQKSVTLLEIYGPPREASGISLVQANCSHVLATVSLPLNDTNRPLEGFVANLWQYDILSGRTALMASAMAYSYKNRNFHFSADGLCKNYSSVLALEVITYGPYGNGIPALKNLKAETANSALDSKYYFCLIRYKLNSFLDPILTLPLLDIVVISNLTAFHNCFNNDTVGRLFQKLDFKLSIFAKRKLILAFIQQLRQNFSIEVGGIQTKRAFSLQISTAGLRLTEAVQKIHELKIAVDESDPIRIGDCLAKIHFGCFLSGCKSLQKFGLESSGDEKEFTESSMYLTLLLNLASMLYTT
eukprot:m.66639 g.66639  ORF g.66639 m.66639 type:complete len:692 (+) comp35396_c0_seq8:252-2327(+)